VIVENVGRERGMGKKKWERQSYRVCLPQIQTDKCRHTDIHRERQTDRQRDRHTATDRQIHRQTETD